MEPPSKRQRLAASRNPEFNIHARRAQNDNRLKSRFESIFERYGRDFDGIGDEIDMKTGEIVVNNGHIQSMTDEKDVGGTKYYAQKLEDTDYEGEHSSVEYSEGESSEQLNFDADGLLSDVPADSRLHQLGKGSKEALRMPSDNDEDELASSDVEWVSTSQDSLGARERFSLLKDKHVFVEEPAIEPAWRAPPLPDITRFKEQEEKGDLASIDYIRECSDDERAGISLWAPQVKKRSRRRHESVSTVDRRSLPFSRGQQNDAAGLRSDSSDSEYDHRTNMKWTQQEDELLTHLKATTNPTWRAMQSYFPERSRNSIASHWRYMMNRDLASPKLQVHTILEPETPPGLGASTKDLTADEIRPKSHNHPTMSNVQERQTAQQQTNSESPEAGNCIRSSREPVEDPGDHLSSQYQAGRGYGTTSGYNGDESNLIPNDPQVPITDSPVSTASERGCRLADSADQAISNLDSFTTVQPHRHGGSRVYHEDDVEVINKDVTTRQFVQVVIPLFTKGNERTQRARSPLTSTETDDPEFMKQSADTVGSVPAASGLNVLDREEIAIRIPTRSPSDAAAESQHIASAAFVLNEVRSSLDVEIADSQPLITTPTGLTTALQPGDDATLPIILDDESSSLSISLEVAPSPQKQLDTATKTNGIKYNSQPLRVSPGIATPARKGIEEATESDILESGSHPLRKPLSASRSLLSKAKKESVTTSFSPIWADIDDCSEDELSYL